MKGRSKAYTLAEILKWIIDNHSYVDVGPGAEINFCVSRYILRKAIHILEDEGYDSVKVPIPMVTDPSKRIMTTWIFSNWKKGDDDVANTD